MISRLNRRRLGGVLFAAAVHLVLAALLVLSLRSKIPLPVTRAIKVVLIPRAFPPPSPPVTLQGRPRVQATTSPRQGPPSQTTLGGAASSAQPAAPIREEPQGVGDGVRAALRAGLGCGSASLLGLSREERRQCQDAMTAGAKAGPQVHVDLDPRGLYGHDPDAEPYLVRRPKKGCKVMATGDQTATGASGAAAGIRCTVPF